MNIMSKFLFYIVSCFVVFSTFFSSVYAVTPIPMPSMGIPLPGTCGDATSADPVLKKCCATPIYTPQLIQLGAPLDIASKFVSDQLAGKLNPVLEMQRQVSVQPCYNGSPSTPGDPNNAACICIAEPTKTPLSTLVPVCMKISTTAEQAACKSCAESSGIWTSLGCFNGNVSEFISEKILGTGVGIAGGISLLCIMLAAFQMQTSGGNAEKIKKAQELLTNCITGLMVIIFSILILKIIGVDILRIPGFSK